MLDQPQTRSPIAIHFERESRRDGVLGPRGQTRPAVGTALARSDRVVISALERDGPL